MKKRKAGYILIGRPHQKKNQMILTNDNFAWAVILIWAMFPIHIFKIEN